MPEADWKQSALFFYCHEDKTGVYYYDNMAESSEGSGAAADEVRIFIRGKIVELVVEKAF